VKRLAALALVLAACSHPPAPRCPPGAAASPVEPAFVDEPVAPPPAPAPPAIDREAIAELAATRSFNLGTPRPVALLPDGDVLFLRTGPRSYVAELFELDAATGAVRKLASAGDLVKSTDVQLSAAEKAKRERMRMALRGIVSVSADRDGARLLIPLGSELFILDRATGAAKAVAIGGGYPDSPLLAPDGKRVAFIRDRDVWVVGVDGGKPTKLTASPGPDVSFGNAEFVAAEELDRTAGMWWAPTGDRLIIQRTDDSKVDTLYVANPRHPDQAPTPFRYPRAGTTNATVGFAIHAVKGGKPTAITWDAAAFPYVHHVGWPKAGAPTMVVLNRAQTELRVLAIDPATGKTTTLLTETNPAWLNTSGGPVWAADGKSFLWTREHADGWALERYGADGKLQGTVIGPDYGFGGQFGVDDDTGEIWFVAGTPVDSQVWSVAPGAAPTRRTDARGTHAIGVAPKGGTRLIVANGADGKRSQTVVRRDGTVVAVVPSVAEDGPVLPTTVVEEVAAKDRTYWTAVTRPRNFDPSKRYPVVLQVYAGPGVTTVTRNPRAYWKDQLLADTGFIVVRGDGRGTPGRGMAWERAIARDLITVPMADQVEILTRLGAKHRELDLARVGAVGWSFGGYFAAMAVQRAPDMFKAAIAGAPVTDWRLYDTAYTERYMGTPDQNPTGYDATSAVVNAASSSRPLLLIHGMTDDNVYAAHSLALTEALFAAGKPFEFVAMSGTHMMADPTSEAALLTKQIEFFRAHLGLPTAP
jgi:dipeptidyl-peptidase-4